MSQILQNVAHLRYMCRPKMKTFFETHCHTFKERKENQVYYQIFVVNASATLSLQTKYVDKIFGDAS